MEKKCSNCGQFYDDQDKFCKYCGCPNDIVVEKKPVEKKLNKRAIEDKIQEQKTLVVDSDMDVASELDYNLITVKRKGELFSLRLRSVLVLILALVVSVAGVAGAVLLKGVKGDKIAIVLGIFVSIVAIFMGFAVAMERYFMINSYNRMKEKTIIVPRYGLRKQPLFMLGGYIFTLDTNCVCPICDGEIKGDLHVEMINGRAVAVCNFNRKHIYNISAERFFEYYLSSKAPKANGESEDVPIDNTAENADNINNNIDNIGVAENIDTVAERGDKALENVDDTSDRSTDNVEKAMENIEKETKDKD